MSYPDDSFFFVSVRKKENAEEEEMAAGMIERPKGCPSGDEGGGEFFFRW